MTQPNQPRTDDQELEQELDAILFDLQEHAWVMGKNILDMSDDSRVSNAKNTIVSLANRLADERAREARIDELENLNRLEEYFEIEDEMERRLAALRAPDRKG